MLNCSWYSLQFICYTGRSHEVHSIVGYSISHCLLCCKWHILANTEGHLGIYFMHTENVHTAYYRNSPSIIFLWSTVFCSVWECVSTRILQRKTPSVSLRAAGNKRALWHLLSVFLYLWRGAPSPSLTFN